ncbi:purine-nucleoside phosphorylase [Clostridium folliculivorans]|uniref:Purine nucleoside phosphorylase n=1 Tax=Clostridium folliculivorans TaxID=2886038 RepID=A0A9W6DBM5_9CLOT|nr:purine-nucleoside phosphorylase [Clostridium folliculivorans]GKU26116.1 purine nucleoside phosphorylase [Clostridium folliculivorans]GKU28202.1 purine nucleoside phosphorylase [Clostridium folliculivorans]
MDLTKKIEDAAEFILSKSKYKPQIGLILGSGLGAIADMIEDAEYYNYNELPNFPVSTVEGHAGRLVIGMLQGKQVVAMQGRFHYYEGYAMEQVTFPVRVMKLLGIDTVIVTNAAGAVNTDFKPGDLMIINDHINLSGTNPLIGKNLDSFGTRFPDMSEAYNCELINKAKDVANSLNIDIKEGVYAMFSGPTYETPAEIRMARILGGDAVGMSTVPEVIIANHSKIKVLGISCLTNMAAGILKQPLNHVEVMETSALVRDNFIALMTNIIKNL